VEQIQAMNSLDQAGKICWTIVTRRQISI
jgi:hypothetical protein